MEQKQEKDSEKQTEEESKKEEQQPEEIIKKSSSYQESEVNEVKEEQDNLPVRFHLYNIYKINSMKLYIFLDN